jgi:hypothetical protein
LMEAWKANVGCSLERCRTQRACQREWSESVSIHLKQGFHSNGMAQQSEKKEKMMCISKTKENLMTKRLVSGKPSVD